MFVLAKYPTSSTRSSHQSSHALVLLVLSAHIAISLVKLLRMSGEGAGDKRVPVLQTFSQLKMFMTSSMLSHDQTPLFQTRSSDFSFSFLYLHYLTSLFYLPFFLSVPSLPFPLLDRLMVCWSVCVSENQDSSIRTSPSSGEKHLDSTSSDLRAGSERERASEQERERECMYACVSLCMCVYRYVCVEYACMRV